MLQELLPLPEWLVVGLAIGLVGSAVVAVLFWIGDRFYPTPTVSGGVNAETRKREELRTYLEAIDEPYAEDHLVAGQPVAFYLPAHDVAITFDARTYFQIAHTDTYPVLVEHEMPGALLGARLPFETPEVSFGTGEDWGETDPGPVVDAYHELGLTAHASVDEVTAAYRRRVKEVHPDLGGDEVAFRRVRDVYATATRHATEKRAATTES